MFLGQAQKNSTKNLNIQLNFITTTTFRVLFVLTAVHKWCFMVSNGEDW